MRYVMQYVNEPWACWWWNIDSNL